ncbi:hypothetical protein EDD11_001841 [Mortierella claussenii]|nr:hypothetical protein EDD11_001841 [Mortierella claussenii]
MVSNRSSRLRLILLLTSAIVLQSVVTTTALAQQSQQQQQQQQQQHHEQQTYHGQERGRIQRPPGQKITLPVQHFHSSALLAPAPATPPVPVVMVVPEKKIKKHKDGGDPDDRDRKNRNEGKKQSDSQEDDGKRKVKGKGTDKSKNKGKGKGKDKEDEDKGNDHKMMNKVNGDKGGSGPVLKVNNHLADLWKDNVHMEHDPTMQTGISALTTGFEGLGTHAEDNTHVDDQVLEEPSADSSTIERLLGLGDNPSATADHVAAPPSTGWLLKRQLQDQQGGIVIEGVRHAEKDAAVPGQYGQLTPVGQPVEGENKEKKKKKDKKHKNKKYKHNNVYNDKNNAFLDDFARGGGQVNNLGRDKRNAKEPEKHVDPFRDILDRIFGTERGQKPVLEAHKKKKEKKHKNKGVAKGYDGRNAGAAATIFSDVRTQGDNDMNANNNNNDGDQAGKHHKKANKKHHDQQQQQAGAAPANQPAKQPAPAPANGNQSAPAQGPDNGNHPQARVESGGGPPERTSPQLAGGNAPGANKDRSTPTGYGTVPMFGPAQFDLDNGVAGSQYSVLKGASLWTTAGLAVAVMVALA